MNTPDKYLKPHQARQRYAVWFGFALFVYTALAFLFGGGRLMAVTGFLALAALAFFFVWFGRRAEQDARKVAEMAVADVMHAGERVVDPWGLQMRVMHASGQRTPGHPRLHQGVLLYSALMMEELGETLSELGAIVLNAGHASNVGLMADRLELLSLSDTYMALGQSLMDNAGALRLSVAEVSDLDVPMNWDQAVSLFDGTTDVAVVNCGFALSCGFPGAAGYREVQLSNRSKVNPATGVIDKTPDGKWIKGVDYWGPDLATVLREQKFSLQA